MNAEVEERGVRGRGRGDRMRREVYGEEERGQWKM